jgi:alkanesulfonate monooxygenase SsuD/methylene tetrahydromethanopterin reductase-like flavin-dependent oxidoreductase (luciferase family)
LSKIRFGVFLPFYAFQNPRDRGSFNAVRDVALECERLGYDAVWVDDHLMHGDWPTLEAWTTLSALSTVTRRLRLGTMVSCTAHRNPALLAKAAATLDVVSGGRLELGLGAGAGEAEHAAYGFDFPEPKARIERLAESVEVITRLWTAEKAVFEGKHFKLKEAVCMPKPLQKPHPPITVGGSGGMLLRKVTAPYADRLDFGYLPSVDQYKRKLDVLRKACSDLGRDFGEVEKSCWPGGQVVIAKTAAELNQKISKMNALGLSLEEFKQVNLAGTPSECLERLRVYVELGVTYFMLYFADLPNVDGPKLFAETIMKELRG